MSKRKKVSTLIIILALLAAAAAAYFFVLDPGGSFENKATDNTKQAQRISACDVFSLDDAKPILGDDIFQNPLDATSGSDSPESTCAYTRKSKLELNNPDQQQSPPADVKPAPEGNEKPVDPEDISKTLEKVSSQTSTLPEFAAVITLRSATQENAAADFNRAKPQSAQDIGGLGKSAFWSPDVLGLSGKKQGSLSVLTEDKIIIVSGDSLSTETAKKIVDLILGRLR